MAASDGRFPTLVVVYDNGTFGGIDADDVKAAMFGDEKVVVTLSNRKVEQVTAIHAGGGRQMTEECNTSISAVGLLYGSHDNASMSVFHNRFAANPIAPEWFRHDRLRHFAILANDCYEWTKV